MKIATGSFLALSWLLMAVPTPTEPEERGICGTPILQANPAHKAAYRPLVQRGEEISVGDVLSFSAWSFSADSYYDVSATCRLVGEHSYILVQDSAWNVYVDQEEIERLAQLFDSSTAAHPDRGVFELVSDTFGVPLDLDHDPRIFILVLDIEDWYPVVGGDYVAGFFDSNFPDGREVIYIDCSPLSLDDQLAKATLAHEFQHLIHWGYDEDEENWINEGCSGYAELVSGYAAGYGPAFLAQPDNSLTEFFLPGTDADYDKTFLFITYLAEQYRGKEIISNLVSEKANGITGVDRALGRLGEEDRFRNVFADWVVANYLDGKGRYGYRSVELGRIAAQRIDSLPASGRSRIQAWAADYVEFVSRESMKIHFDGDRGGEFNLRIVSKEGGWTSVVDFPLEARNAGDLVVPEADTVALVISRTSGFPSDYYYSAEKPMPALVDLGLETDLPQGWALYQNFPNPFNRSTLIPFLAPLAGRVVLEIFNPSGQNVKTLLDGPIGPGRHTFRWDGRDEDGGAVASGLYLVRMHTLGGTFSMKVTLVR